MERTVEQSLVRVQFTLGVWLTSGACPKRIYVPGEGATFPEGNAFGLPFLVGTILSKCSFPKVFVCTYRVGIFLGDSLQGK